jgi:hypothetical protein
VGGCGGVVAKYAPLEENVVHMGGSR